VQQHRTLSVLVLALVILSSAGGTAWALVFRTVSSPVGLREALRMYRKEQTERMVASLKARMPAPGVYVYRTSGGESLNIVGVSRGFPQSTAMIVTDERCATVSWVPITQHTEATTLCAEPGGGLTLPRLQTVESIAGTTTNSSVDCPGTAYLVPPHPGTGSHWSASCSLTSPAERVTLEGVDLGPATVDVGGRPVPVEHVRLTYRYLGGTSGTSPTDYWVVPATGLIVREKEHVAVAQGSVHYSEDMDAALTSLQPSR
jgi:hypothetical protein